MLRGCVYIGDVVVSVDGERVHGNDKVLTDLVQEAQMDRPITLGLLQPALLKQQQPEGTGVRETVHMATWVEFSSTGSPGGPSAASSPGM